MSWEWHVARMGEIIKLIPSRNEVTKMIHRSYYSDVEKTKTDRQAMRIAYATLYFNSVVLNSNSQENCEAKFLFRDYSKFPPQCEVWQVF